MEVKYYQSIKKVGGVSGLDGIFRNIYRPQVINGKIKDYQSLFLNILEDGGLQTIFQVQDAVVIIYSDKESKLGKMCLKDHHPSNEKLPGEIRARLPPSLHYKNQFHKNEPPIIWRLQFRRFQSEYHE